MTRICKLVAHGKLMYGNLLELVMKVEMHVSLNLGCDILSPTVGKRDCAANGSQIDAVKNSSGLREELPFADEVIEVEPNDQEAQHVEQQQFVADDVTVVDPSEVAAEQQQPVFVASQRPLVAALESPPRQWQTAAATAAAAAAALPQ